ncbi:hypothetical protein AAF712_006201 [Marasmius tenuissimus]|uniref:Uncharacterized protein n=1 Tax=Marasmius tenuissimus TaxID=585030 RepID=A0ABR3A0D8_9AGAR
MSTNLRSAVLDSDVEMNDVSHTSSHSSPQSNSSAHPILDATAATTATNDVIQPLTSNLEKSGIKVIDYAFRNLRVRSLGEAGSTSMPMPGNDSTSSSMPATPAQSSPLHLPTSSLMADLPDLLPPTMAVMFAKRDLATYDYYISRGSTDAVEDKEDDIRTEVGEDATTSASNATSYGKTIMLIDNKDVTSASPHPLPADSPPDDHFRFLFPENVTQLPRTRPIPGSIIFRLLGIQWLTREELERQLLPMDWEEYDAYVRKMGTFKRDIEERLAAWGSAMFRHMQREGNGRIDMAAFQTLVSEKSRSILRFGLNGKEELGYPYRVMYKEHPRLVYVPDPEGVLSRSKYRVPVAIPREFEEGEDRMLGVGRPPTREYRRFLRAHHALDLEGWERRYEKLLPPVPSSGIPTSEKAKEAARRVTSWIRGTRGGEAMDVDVDGGMSIEAAGTPKPKSASPSHVPQLQMPRTPKANPSRASLGSVRSLQRTGTLMLGTRGILKPSPLRKPLSPHPSYGNLRLEGDSTGASKGEKTYFFTSGGQEYTDMDTAGPSSDTDKAKTWLNSKRPGGSDEAVDDEELRRRIKRRKVMRK